MAVLPILHYPDPRLAKIAAPVTAFDAALKTLVQNMADTMYAAPGVGLAATQVDVHQQVVVIDVSENGNELRVFINPKITDSSLELAPYEEGCLSVPSVYETVNRPARVTVQAQDVNGKAFTLEAVGLLAVCIQHELDHLNGKVFVQYLSGLKQSRIKTKLAKEAREALREAAAN